MFVTRRRRPLPLVPDRTFESKVAPPRLHWSSCLADVLIFTCDVSGRGCHMEMSNGPLVHCHEASCVILTMRYGTHHGNVLYLSLWTSQTLLQILNHGDHSESSVPPESWDCAAASSQKKSRSFGLYEPWVSVHETVVHCQLPTPALPGPSGLVVAAFQEHPVFRTALIIDTRINSFWDSFGLCVGKLSGQISGNSLSHKARRRDIRHINANVFVVFRQFNLPEVRARENLRVRHHPGRWFGVTH